MGLQSHYSKYAGVHKFDLPAAVLFSAAILFFITGFDIFIHDTFVLPSYHCDDPASADLPECQPINSTTTILQFEITGREWYWIWFSGIMYGFAILPTIFRGVILGSLKAGFLWFITIIIPINAGFEDYLYFATRGLPIPTEMPWLDSNFFINIVNGIFNAHGTITSSILYLSMGIGVSILTIAWVMALRKH